MPNKVMLFLSIIHDWHRAELAVPQLLIFRNDKKHTLIKTFSVERTDF